MRAAVMEGIGALRTTDVPEKDLEKGGVIVKVESCAICATDIKLLRYGHPAITSYPHILGHEMAGTVVKVSPEVKHIAVGDRVALAPTIPCNNCAMCAKGAKALCSRAKIMGYHYWGGFAQYVSVPAIGVERNQVKKVPDHVSMDEAALVEPLACVINGQEKVEPRPGDTVVILGVGPIGCLHILLARARGATKIIAANRSSRTRLSLASRFPADIFVNQAEQDLKKVVMDATGGRGADVVIVCTPAKEALALSLEMIAPRGRVLFFGGLPKNDPFFPFDANVVHYKECTVHGSFSASPEHCDTALELISSGRIDVKDLITHTVDLDHVADGMDLITKGESIKVMIHPWS